jgi:hypothetical protein
MADNANSSDLNTLQRWFQTIITHPATIGEAIDSQKAQALIRMDRSELESIIRRSKTLSAEQRIGIYANAYHARLLECLRESFPILTRALGEDTFNDFAFEYLQRYPPHSYTLNRLADHFVQFLNETRPDSRADKDDVPIDWPNFLIDLARLEWNIEEVFDGPGIEKERPLSASDIRDISPDRSIAAHLITAPCLRILQFAYPVNSYYSAARSAAPDKQVEIPSPDTEYVALTRRDYIVRRIRIDLPQYALLEAILSGRSLADAIHTAGDPTAATDEIFAANLKSWFETWTAAGFFLAVRFS